MPKGATTGASGSTYVGMFAGSTGIEGRALSATEEPPDDED